MLKRLLQLGALLILTGGSVPASAATLQGTSQSFSTTYTEVDPDAKITVTTTDVDAAAQAGTSAAYVHEIKAVDYFTGWRIRFTAQCSAASASGAELAFSGISDDVGGFETWTTGASVTCYYDGANYQFKVSDESSGGSVDTSINITASTEYFLEFRRAGKLLTVIIYTDSGFSTIHDTIQITDFADDFRARQIYAFAAGGAGGSSATMTTNTSDMVIYTFDIVADTWLGHATALTVEDDFEATFASSGWIEAEPDAPDGDPGSWDLLDEDWTDITDWTAQGTGTVEESPAGQLHTDAGTGDFARAFRDIGTIPNEWTLEWETDAYDSLGTLASGNYAVLLVREGTYSHWIHIGTDNIEARETGGFTTASPAVTTSTATGYVWRIIGTTAASGTLKLYRKPTAGSWALLETWTGLFTGGTDGEMFVGWVVGTAEQHEESIQMATGEYVPGTVDTTLERSTTQKVSGSYSAHFISTNDQRAFLYQAFTAGTEESWIYGAEFYPVSVDTGAYLCPIGATRFTATRQHHLACLQESGGKYYWAMAHLNDATWTQTTQTVYEAELNNWYSVKLYKEPTNDGTDSESVSLFVDGILVVEKSLDSGWDGRYPERVYVGNFAQAFTAGGEMYVDDVGFRKDEHLLFSSLSVSSADMFVVAGMHTQHSQANSDAYSLLSVDNGLSFSNEESWASSDDGYPARGIAAIADVATTRFHFGYGFESTDPNGNGLAEDDFGHTVTERVGNALIRISEAAGMTAWAASTDNALGDKVRRLDGRTITAASAANPTQLDFDAAHHLSTNDKVIIANSTTTPSIDGEYTITSVDGDSLTIPVNVTSGCASGCGTADIERLFEVTTDAGSTGGTEPAWNFTKGGTTVDSGITWTARHPGDDFRFYPSNLTENDEVLGIAYWRNGGKPYAYISFAVYDTITGLFEDASDADIYREHNTVTKLADVGDMTSSGPQDLQPSETDMYRLPETGSIGSAGDLVAIISWGNTTVSNFDTFKNSYKVSSNDGLAFGANNDLQSQWGTKRGRVRLNVIGGDTMFVTAYAKYDPAETDVALQQQWIADLDPATLDILNEKRVSFPTFGQDMGNGDSLFGGVDGATGQYFLDMVLNSGPAVYYKVLVPYLGDVDYQREECNKWAQLTAMEPVGVTAGCMWR